MAPSTIVQVEVACDQVNFYWGVISFYHSGRKLLNHIYQSTAGGKCFVTTSKGLLLSWLKLNSRQCVFATETPKLRSCNSQQFEIFPLPTLCYYLYSQHIPSVPKALSELSDNLSNV